MRRTVAFVLTLGLALMLTLGSAVAGEKVYVNGIDFGFPPFGFVDKAGNPAGFDVDSVNWIAKKMGFKVKHQPMDWDGIIPALNAGKIDLIASGMSVTPEREKVVDFTVPYYKVTQVLVVRQGESDSMDSILKSGAKVGVQRGTPTEKLLIELKAKPGYKFDLVPYDSSDLSMQDLAIGRIKATGMDSSIANELLGAKDGFKVSGTFDTPPDNYGYAVRKKDKKLLETLNTGLELLMADPYWQQLKDKWGVH